VNPPYRHAVSVDIDAPAERVWSVMVDVERWPEWTRSIESVTLLDPGPLGVGHRAKIKQPKFPETIWEVTAIDQGSSFTWVAISPGAVVEGSHVVEPRGQGSRVTLSVSFRGFVGRLVGFLTRGITLRYLGYEANGLRERSTRPGEKRQTV